MSSLYCHHQLMAEYRVTDRQASRKWDVMLKADFYIQRRQWRFVRGHRFSEEAYYDGMAFVRTRYGEHALWQMVPDARSGSGRKPSRRFRCA